MSKYEQYDKTLLGLLKHGIGTLDVMCRDATLKALGEPHKVKDRYGNLTPDFRIVDRRLQALRKAGTIRYSNKRWEIV